jgi:protein arginine kinase activator
MLCEQCKERDASVHLTRMDKGEVSQVHLCEKCAAERGIETTLATPKAPITTFLQSVHQQMAVVQQDTVRCSFCQTSLRDFRSSGRLGCAHCYGAFESSLRELLRRVHGNSKHTGREYRPPQPETMERATTLLELRDRLRRAVELEQFELAAALRDQIKVLE